MQLRIGVHLSMQKLTDLELLKSPKTYLCTEFCDFVAFYIFVRFFHKLRIRLASVHTVVHKLCMYTVC